jgi:hypothetical protein
VVEVATALNCFRLDRIAAAEGLGIARSLPPFSLASMLIVLTWMFRLRRKSAHPQSEHHAPSESLCWHRGIIRELGD